ncbi:YcbK family protein [Microvirga sp. BT688]|uniref:YcbK family protein n=1 Tax=Microvirga sp. TaxID=1873136 RepID=UPI001689A963|nr:DUF882 domain-containing protein [Microvirga sp.]MBD2745758.1 YcbK family protein [Microvirga sp.]
MLSRRQMLAGLAASASLGHSSLARAQVAFPVGTQLIPPLAGPEHLEMPSFQFEPSAEAPQLSNDMKNTDLASMTAKAPLTQAGLPAHRGLWLVNYDTNEEIKTVFWKEGVYDKPAYSQLCHMLRDWREKVTMAMDPKLFHLLWAIQHRIGFEQPIIITSGFRTKKTNDMLRDEGSAINSLHMHSQASDIVVNKVPAETIAKYAKAIGIGGIGKYRNFTHVDTGEIRSWVG